MIRALCICCALACAMGCAAIGIHSGVPGMSPELVRARDACWTALGPVSLPPPSIRLVAEGLTCEGSRHDGRPGFMIESGCVDGTTTDMCCSSVAYHREPFDETAAPHEETHQWIWRKYGDPDQKHLRSEWGDGLNRCTAAMKAARG